MITSDRLQKALTYLAETDESCAEAKAQVERCAYTCKHARALEFQIAEGSIEARKAAAEVSAAVQKAEDQRIAAIIAYEKLKAKRETEALIVDVWRSLNASRRAGNIT